MGLGIIKTAKDVRNLQRFGILDRLMNIKFLPKGHHLNKEQRETARQSIFDIIFDDMARRDELPPEEVAAGKKGVLDQFSQSGVQK